MFLSKYGRFLNGWDHGFLEQGVEFYERALYKFYNLGRSKSSITEAAKVETEAVIYKTLGLSQGKIIGSRGELRDEDQWLFGPAPWGRGYWPQRIESFDKLIREEKNHGKRKERGKGSAFIEKTWKTEEGEFFGGQVSDKKGNSTWSTVRSVFYYSSSEDEKEAEEEINEEGVEDSNSTVEEEEKPTGSKKAKRAKATQNEKPEKGDL